MTSVNSYAEASGIGGGPSALSQGLESARGNRRPDARRVRSRGDAALSVRRHSARGGRRSRRGALALMLQAPTSLWRDDRREGHRAARRVDRRGTRRRRRAASCGARSAGISYAPETSTVVLGHLLRGAVDDRHRRGGGRARRERRERRDHRAHDHARAPGRSTTSPRRAAARSPRSRSVHAVGGAARVRARRASRRDGPRAARARPSADSRVASVVAASRVVRSPRRRVGVAAVRRARRRVAVRRSRTTFARAAT